MKDQMIPGLLYVAAAVVGAAGQYAYKVGAAQLSKVPVYFNWPLFAGMALFCAVMVLFVLSFKLGGRLSVVYPIYATTFIWGCLIGVFIEKEPVSAGQVASIALVVMGSAGVAFFAPEGN